MALIKQPWNINQEYGLLIRYSQSKSYNDGVENEIAQKKAVLEYKKTMKLFEQKLAKDIKTNPKSCYAYVRLKSKVKDKVGPLKDSNGHVVSENEEISELLNEHHPVIIDLLVWLHTYNNL